MLMKQHREHRRVQALRQRVADRRTVLHARLVDTHRRWYPHIARPKWLPVAFLAGFGFERLMPRRHVFQEASATLAGMIQFEQIARAFADMLARDRRVYRPPAPDQL